MKIILSKIKKTNIPLSKNFNLNKFNDKEDLLYHINSDLFENNKINHRERINGLNSLRKLLSKEKLDFLIAHNLVLSGKVEQELGNIKKSIDISTKAYKLFNKMLNTNKLNPKCEIVCEILCLFTKNSLIVVNNKYKAAPPKIDVNKISVDVFFIK